MSMSEFDKLLSGSQPDPLATSRPNEAFPDDFSEADVAFAHELESLFSPKDEELPPLFVQTLLASEDPRFQPVENGFEGKTRAHVFRRLHLKQRLFHTPRPSFSFVLHSFAASRPFIALSSAALIFMVLTVFFTGTSFASGLNYLWAGAHSGVLQVDHYPSLSRPLYAANKQVSASNQASTTDQMNLFQAQRLLTFPIYWPKYVPARYSQSDIYLYKGDPIWADGPILVLNFYYAVPGFAPRQITICEFKPNGTVLDVVQSGAARQVKIDATDPSNAVYVEGQWTSASSSSPTWVYSERSQFIHENNGVIFWVVGDQRDGIDDTELSSITSSLDLLSHTYNKAGGYHLNRLVQREDNSPWVFANDVIFLNNPDNPNGPSFKLVEAPSDPPRPHFQHIDLADS